MNDCVVCPECCLVVSFEVVDVSLGVVFRKYFMDVVSAHAFGYVCMTFVLIILSILIYNSML